MRREPAPREDDPDAADPLETTASDDPNPERLVLSAELGAGVRAAMESLSATERAAFLLRHVEGFSIEEIARSLDLNIGATKNSVFRAVQKLRRHLDPLVSVAR